MSEEEKSLVLENDDYFLREDIFFGECSGIDENQTMIAIDIPDDSFENNDRNDDGYSDSVFATVAENLQFVSNTTEHIQSLQQNQMLEYDIDQYLSRQMMPPRTSSSRESPSLVSEKSSELQSVNLHAPANEENLPVSSDCYTPSISTDYSADQLSNYSKEALTYSRHETRARNYPIECSEAIGTESMWTKVNNKFYYSSKTRKIRDYCNKLLDIEEYNNAPTLRANLYGEILSIKYIVLPFIHFIMEDLLDFVDFLNGTELELREPKSTTCKASRVERQLGFVRENFIIGVQQLESQTVNLLIQIFENYFFEKSSVLGDNSNPNDIVHLQFLRFFKFSVVDISKVAKESRKSNSNKDLMEIFSELMSERCRLKYLQKELQQIDINCILERLNLINEIIIRSVKYCVSDIRTIVDFCLDSSNHRWESRLKNYIYGIKCMLQRLSFLRIDCALLLQNCYDENESLKIKSTLKVKFLIATVLRELLSKLMELNSEFLETT